VCDITAAFPTDTRCITNQYHASTSQVRGCGFFNDIGASDTIRKLGYRSHYSRSITQRFFRNSSVPQQIGQGTARKHW
jgi:hypothetical protein